MSIIKESFSGRMANSILFSHHGNFFLDQDISVVSKILTEVASVAVSVVAIVEFSVRAPFALISSTFFLLSYPFPKVHEYSRNVSKNLGYSLAECALVVVSPFMPFLIVFFRKNG